MTARHSSSKAVLALATGIVWLIRALHVDRSGAERAPIDSSGSSGCQTQSHPYMAAAVGRGSADATAAFEVRPTGCRDRPEICLRMFHRVGLRGPQKPTLPYTFGTPLADVDI